MFWEDVKLVKDSGEAGVGYSNTQKGKQKPEQGQILKILER